MVGHRFKITYRLQLVAEQTFRVELGTQTGVGVIVGVAVGEGPQLRTTPPPPLAPPPKPLKLQQTTLLPLYSSAPPKPLAAKHLSGFAGSVHNAEQLDSLQERPPPQSGSSKHALAGAVVGVAVGAVMHSIFQTSKPAPVLLESEEKPNFSVLVAYGPFQT